MKDAVAVKDEEEEEEETAADSCNGTEEQQQQRGENYEDTKAAACTETAKEEEEDHAGEDASEGAYTEIEEITNSKAAECRNETRRKNDAKLAYKGHFRHLYQYLEAFRHYQQQGSGCKNVEERTIDEGNEAKNERS